MAHHSGQHGRMYLQNANAARVEVGFLKNWSYSMQQSPLDTTCMGDVDKTIIQGVRSTTGQASLLYYSSSGTSNAATAWNAIFPGADTPPKKVDIELEVTGGGNIKMEAYVTNFNMTCAVGEVVTAEVSWEAIGAPERFTY